MEEAGGSYPLPKRGRGVGPVLLKLLSMVACTTNGKIISWQKHRWKETRACSIPIRLVSMSLVEIKTLQFSPSMGLKNESNTCRQTAWAISFRNAKTAGYFIVGLNGSGGYGYITILRLISILRKLPVSVIATFCIIELNCWYQWEITTKMGR